MFNSRYPIIALAMNGVSDVKFAIACAQAGVFPSISWFNNNRDYKSLMANIVEFKTATGNTNFMFSLAADDLLDKSLIAILKASQVQFLEVVMPWMNPPDRGDRYTEKFAELRSQGFVIFQRTIEYDPKIDVRSRNGYWFQYLDGVILKGNKGAGAISNQSLEEMFMFARRDFPNKHLIVAGGIYNKRQVDSFINFGAVAVGIGTMFAASKESCLSEETKQRMLSANFVDVKKNSLDEKNALVFRKVPINYDKNHTASLKLGIHRPDIGGHIYCGEAIDSIKEIKSLQEIVQQLVT